jgi:energy-coupling factor transporter ATP-binding protein EcfA2
MTFRMEHVCFSYREKHRGSPLEVFRDLSLAIADGECLVLLGREGSGKSTLLFMLDGLTPPDSGTVLVGGKDPHADRRYGREIRRRIACAFQFPEEQFLQATVAEEFADFLAVRGVRDNEVPGRMASSLAFAGLAPESTGARSPFTLSAGESRRLVLALAHAARPDAVLLDEPTAGMDATAGAFLCRFVHEERKRGTTIVVATHDVDLAAEIADRVLILDDGRAAVEGNAGDVLTAGETLACYGYEVPETVALAEKLRTQGREIPGGLIGRAALLAMISPR